MVVQAGRKATGNKVVRVKMEGVDRFEGCLGGQKRKPAPARGSVQPTASNRLKEVNARPGIIHSNLLSVQKIDLQGPRVRGLA